MCSVRNWWREKHMPFQDSYLRVLILVSLNCGLKGLLPSGCLYLLRQGNSLSRYLTIRIRWKKNSTWLYSWYVTFWIQLMFVICRPFFGSRKSIPLSSLSDIRLSKYFDTLVCLYVSFCYQIKKGWQENIWHCLAIIVTVSLTLLHMLCTWERFIHQVTKRNNGFLWLMDP